MKRILAAVAILGVVAGSGSAVAQTQAKKDEPKKETIDFNRTVIEGEAARPSLQIIYVHKAARFANRMSTRGDFLPELLGSVDSL